MKQPPADYREIDETVMSNIDHRINQSRAQRLRDEKVIMDYTALEFCGSVWFEDNLFHCTVSVWGIPRQTFSASTLEELMHDVSE